ncbi:hypothetical protein HII36_33010 [Nonomuraea sp. NN258]|nr:hypothetical protein [Nonomuraea antri]NRQ36620.1 hypothetical protein [Nonomuraea antri]
MSWADMARLTGVTVSAIRKWRTGGQASAEKRLELARLAAFLDLLEENCIEDPAQWMEVTFPLGEGYAIRPMELYVAGHKAELLDIACGRRNAADVLDSLDSSWRDARRSNVDVYIGPDGEPALRIRDSQ